MSNFTDNGEYHGSRELRLRVDFTLICEGPVEVANLLAKGPCAPPRPVVFLTTREVGREAWAPHLKWGLFWVISFKWY